MQVVPDALGTIGVDLFGHLLYPIYMPNSFADVIELFGGPAAFARAVGMTPGAAKQAKRRNSISAEWFTVTAQAARLAKISSVDERVLSALADSKRSA